MTREEAIERFENVKANALAQKASGVSEYWQNEIDGTIEALDMAIEALSAECVKETHDSDLISRAEAIEAVENNSYGMGSRASVKAIKALPSAEAVQGWIPFTRRPMTEEEQKDYPNCTFMFDCVLPEDGDEILVSNGRFVWMDTFCNDIDGCYLDGGDDIDEDMAWMPLPKPYKGGDE